MPDDTPTAPGSADDWRPDTRAIRAGRQFSRDSLAPVLFPSTTYEVGSVDDHRRMAGTPRTSHYYSRFGSPSVQEFEAAVADLEGAEAALASSSGMAAVTGVVFGLCSAGDHIVVQRQLFSVTSSLFTAHVPRFGIEVTFVDGTDPQQFADAVRPGPHPAGVRRDPGQPGPVAHGHRGGGRHPGPVHRGRLDVRHARWCSSRSRLGADLVLHAATKGIAGHNDALLGVVAGSRDLIDAVWGWHVVQGGQASPFDAWNGLRGIRTLGVRVRQQSATARVLAEHLEAHPAVTAVSYPGLDSHPQRDLAKRQMSSGGTLVTFELAGGLDAARRFCESTEIARIALSLGGPETLVTHPATIAGHLTPAERAGDGHHRRSRAPLGRARGPRRPGRGPRPGPRRRGGRTGG